MAGEAKFSTVFDLEGVSSTLGFLPETDKYALVVRDESGKALDRVAYVDIKEPNKLQTLIAPVLGREIEDVRITEDGLLVKFQVDLGHRLALYDFEGKLKAPEFDLVELGLPPGSIGQMQASGNVVRFKYESLINPAAEYTLDLKTRELTLVEPSNLPFDPSRFVVETTHYASKDGTQIPMFVLKSRDSAQIPGPKPTILYGYGGFDVDVADRQFVSQGFIPFLEAGGTVALPALRGGAELGDAWHEAGKLANKQRVFDDFIGAAEALIDRGETTTPQLGIMGASNGGLLVGAALVQRPDLFGAAIPHAGVMDMLRFHKFSGGRWWVDEYGDPDNSEHYKTLKTYSPYHNVKDAQYPAVLVTGGRFDSRVDPSHSYKFLAALQAHQKGTAPIYGYFAPDAGHWPPNDPKRAAEFAAYRIGFMMDQLGLPVPKKD
ncbi:MAG: prolyl oligopeptidase family serine peptidase [Myxococcota bacterium]